MSHRTFSLSRNFSWKFPENQARHGVDALPQAAGAVRDEARLPRLCFVFGGHPYHARGERMREREREREREGEPRACRRSFVSPLPGGVVCCVMLFVFVQGKANPECEYRA